MNQNPTAGSLVPLLLLTLVVGACLPLQAGINARLGREFGGPMVAALISLSIGAVSLLLVALAMKAIPFSVGTALAKIPYWAWSGGFLGAIFVTLAATVAPKLGFSLFTGAIIAGQLIMSVLLDHFGVFGMERHPITLVRVIGIVLLFAGIWLLRK